jgi:hypothetical protein
MMVTSIFMLRLLRPGLSRYIRVLPTHFFSFAPPTSPFSRRLLFSSAPTMAATVYDFKVKDSRKAEVDLSAYKGKVIVVVNVASKCGFTPQYAGLEKLYQTYKDKGLVILGFPCNQFLSQEPGNEEEIVSFCSRTYDVTFPM